MPGNVDTLNHAHRVPDLVLVYPKRTLEHEKRRTYYQQELVKQGLNITTDTALGLGHEELVFVRISGSFPTLCNQAEELRLPVPLKVGPDSNTRQRSMWLTAMDKIPFLEDQIKNRFKPTRICWPFERHLIPLYALEDAYTFFTPTQRIEMVWKIMQETRCDPNVPRKRGIADLLEEGIYKAAYPVHDGETKISGSHSSNGEPLKFHCVREELMQTWASWKSFLRAQPLHLIRFYFGEKVALYFAFMDFYTSALVLPAICGFIAFVYGMAYSNTIVDEICDATTTPGNLSMCPMCEPPNCEPFLIAGPEGCNKARWEYRFDTYATLVVSCIMCFWAPLFLKFWKRREARLAFEWSTHNRAHYMESTRPQYDFHASDERPNEITGEIEPYVTTKQRLWRVAVSSLCTIALLCVLCGCLAALVISRIALYRGFHDLGGYFKHTNVEWSRWTIHGLIFVLVAISEKIYHPLAEKLTDFERPRTESEFVNNFLWKLFIFELLNEFLPLLYSAFIKGNFVDTPDQLGTFTEMCELGGCLSEVVELTAVLLVFRLLLGNFLEIAVPAMQNTLRKCRQENKVDDEESANDHPAYPHSQHVQDFFLNEHELDGVSDDLMEMMVQLAFCTILIPAFPLAPLVCLINNIVEIRLDAQKFVKYHRRPLPDRVQGIGIWNRFMDIIIKVAVIYNAALISFTSNIIPRAYYYGNHGSYSGFAQFMLTEYKLHDAEGHNWHHIAEEFNITECWFEDLRERHAPYDYRIDWWKTMTTRISVFCAFTLSFYAFQWFVNIAIADVPHDVEVEILKREFKVKSYTEGKGGKGSKKRVPYYQNGTATSTATSSASSTTNGSLGVTTNGVSHRQVNGVTTPAVMVTSDLEILHL